MHVGIVGATGQNGSSIVNGLLACANAFVSLSLPLSQAVIDIF
jgi:aspartate-semialdehyde dehydrogenase